MKRCEGSRLEGDEANEPCDLVLLLRVTFFAFLASRLLGYLLGGRFAGTSPFDCWPIASLVGFAFADDGSGFAFFFDCWSVASLAAYVGGRFAFAFFLGSSVLCTLFNLPQPLPHVPSPLPHAVRLGTG